MKIGSLIETTNEYILAEMAIDEYLNGNDSLLEAYANGDLEYLYETVKHEEKMRRRAAALQELEKRGDTYYNFRIGDEIESRIKEKGLDREQVIKNNRDKRNIRAANHGKFSKSNYGGTYLTPKSRSEINSGIGRVQSGASKHFNQQEYPIDNRGYERRLSLDSLGLKDQASKFSSNIDDKIKAHAAKSKILLKARNSEVVKNMDEISDGLRDEIKDLQGKLKSFGYEPREPKSKKHNIYGLNINELKEYRAELQKQLNNRSYKSENTPSFTGPQPEKLDLRQHQFKNLSPEEQAVSVKKVMDAGKEYNDKKEQAKVEKETKAKMEENIKKAESQPKSVIYRMISSLRNLYQKWLERQNKAKSQGQNIGFFQNICRIILNCIDKLVKKVQTMAS